MAGTFRRARAQSARMFRVVAIATCVSMLPAVAPAQAGDPPRAPAARSDLSAQVKQLFDAGKAAAKKLDWEKARTFFLSAWRIQEHPLVALHLGRAELNLGRMRDAAEHLSYFLRESPNVDAAERREIEPMLARARARVGAVRIAVSPPGAEVLVDGVVIGKAPLSGLVFVEPGARKIAARAEGYVAAERAVTLMPGGEARVDLALAIVPRAVDVGKGRGSGAGEEKKGPNKAVVITGLVLTVAAVGVGAGFMAGSFAKSNPRPKQGSADQHECDRNGCPFNQAELERAAFARASLGGFVTAGALGVGTLAYWLATRQPKDAGGAKVGAAVGPGGGGVTVMVPW